MGAKHNEARASGEDRVNNDIEMGNVIYTVFVPTRVLKRRRIYGKASLQRSEAENEMTMLQR